MPSVQRFLSGRNNLVRHAVLAASSVRPSTAIERIAAQRTGGGRVRLAGAYTGHEAAQVDVEIVAAGGIPRASVPQFVGVGNGQLSVQSVDGAAPLQGLTLSLVDLGIPTEHARLDARQVQIRAKVAGAAGNDIRITVEPQLTRTLTAWALLGDWSAGTAVQTGSQWDFGGLPLSAQGDVDPDSPRIQFGFDPQVYRPWRQYKDGAWQFGLSPALERTQPKGTAVYAVAGGYKITVVPTDGTAVPVYAQVGVELQLVPGGIPFVLGDVFSLAIEAGQYRWRQGGGAWSALTDIPAAGADVLADGLTVHFDAGAAPSFAPGDAYGFDVHQPWAVSHVRDALASMWGWAGSDANMVIDLGSVQDLGAVALARYELPEGAAVSVELSDDALTWSASLAMDVSRAVSVQFGVLQARYVRVSVVEAPGGSIGWIWAGQPLATDHHASTCQRRRRWAVGRGSGINPAGLYAGVGDGWSLAWSLGNEMRSVLLENDVQQLIALLDWAQNTDEPLLFAPSFLSPNDASLVRFGNDALDVDDKHQFQPNGVEHRVLSAALELEPVFA